MKLTSLHEKKLTLLFRERDVFAIEVAKLGLKFNTLFIKIETEKDSDKKDKMIKEIEKGAILN